MKNLKKEDLSRTAYWHANLKILVYLLIIWFTASFLLGVVFVKQLNQFKLGGFKLGFWFAQQGAIYIFILIIFYYIWKMDKLDKAFNVDE